MQTHLCSAALIGGCVQTGIRQAAFKSEVQWAHRIALGGMLDRQKGHSLAVAAGAGGGASARFIPLIARVKRKITKATMRKSIQVLIKDPQFMVAAPAFLSSCG